MNVIAALRYGPHAPIVEAVALVADGKDLVVVTTEDRLVFARDALRMDPPLTGVPRRLHAPDGSMIETDAADVIDGWCGRRERVARIASALERHWLAAIGIAGIAALLVWLIVAYAMPLLAEPVAARMSPRAEQVIGERALATFDRMLARKSTLPEQERQRIAALVWDFMQAEPVSDYRLEFRQLGTPNAFALPGNIIVVTDELVEFVANDQELLAIIPHELGHARHHHAIRLVLQQSGVAVLMTAIAGDAVGMTILAAGVPSMLLNARYSRALESEADAYAFDALRRHDISP